MARGKPSINKLLSAMRKLSVEVNDHEVCRKLEILMNSEKDDFSPALARRIIDLPPDFDPREVPEPYTQYIRHYLYMVRRSQKEESEGAGDSGLKKSPSRKKTRK